MKNRILKQIIIDSSIAATLLILLSGWGFTGHQKITSQAGNMLNQKIEGFDKLTPFIVEHSTDPDFRKSWVRTEFPKHFIDIDNYPEFTSSGNITSNYDSLKAKHGEEFIIEQGTLPWATKIAFDSLLQCFKRNDFPGTGFWAANLSHYVGDGHMPLHTTRNYDGEETGNKGIHVRYESKMISVFADSLLSRPKQINYIENTDSLIFNYIYQSNRVADSILNADTRAKQLIGNINSQEYLSELWRNTSALTSNQFERASETLGCLIYTAWTKAGSPGFTSEYVEKNSDCTIVSVTQSEDLSILRVNYQINHKGQYKIDIRNSDGGPLLKGEKFDTETGSFVKNIDISTLSTGSYLVIIDCASHASTVVFDKK